MRLNISFVFYLCVVAVVGGVAAAPAVAKSTVQLSGIVQDSSGASIPGATVVIEGPASSFSRIVESGRDGAFVVPSLTAGRYQLTVVATGFDAVTTTVEVPGKAPLTMSCSRRQWSSRSAWYLPPVRRSCADLTRASS